MAVNEEAQMALQKLPPQNIEAEQMVLGAILVEEGAIDLILDILSADDFYKDTHRVIYTAMLDMHEKRETIDIVTLSERLRGSVGLEKAGGASYLATLVYLTPTAAGIKSHAHIVREKAIFRRTIIAASKIIGDGYDTSKNLTSEEYVDKAERAIFEIAQGRRSSESFVSSRKAVLPSFNIIEKRYENKGKLTGIETGFVDLDGYTAGLQNTDLIIIAGRPSMGKTAFALNVTAHSAIAKNRKVGIFSLEMSREQLVIRMIGSESRVDANRLRTGNIRNEDWDPLSLAAGKISEAPIYIDDSANLSVMEIRARARRLKAQIGLDLLIIDYLQLMRGNGKENSREQEISGISRALKALAKELCIPVVALSQLNRAVESRAIPKPKLSDLRESGAIEQDADVILFIHRQEVFDECKCGDECVCGRRGAAEIIIGKQRNGPVGKVDLTYLTEITRFENAMKR